jgi:hypothetical protein
VADAVTVIQATLAPIFLVSGAAIFLNFTQARLFRVIDRLRAVGAELDKVGEPKRRAGLLAQRARHIRRAVILRNAILFGVLVIAFTVLTTLLILASASGFGLDPGPASILFFAGALLSFMVALTLVVVDAFISVASAREAAQEFAEGLRPGEA